MLSGHSIVLQKYDAQVYVHLVTSTTCCCLIPPLIRKKTNVQKIAHKSGVCYTIATELDTFLAKSGLPHFFVFLAKNTSWPIKNAGNRIGIHEK
jgi:hypothetical protein